jgi:Uma2 family endonuclease
MSEPARTKMTADEFIAWAMEQPEGQRYELANGEIVAMAPERSGHALTKFQVARRLFEAVERAKLECMVYPDGMAVAVDESTIYEPDALVRCGPCLPADALKVFDPLVVVEVSSPSTGSIDTGIKLEDYFRIPSVRHYLILRTDHRAIIHHRRDEEGAIATRIIHDNVVTLDPPGITISDLFA